MTFLEEIQKSHNQPRVLVQIDIGFTQDQWVNAGAGIWYVNTNNIYTYADLGLPPWFTAQHFGDIGSVTVEAVSQVEVPNLPSLTTQTEAFFYDASDGSLYVHLINNDNPFIHNIVFGAVFGYSYDGLTPASSTTFYEGRLLAVPEISKSRDALFFGRIQYQGGNIVLANGDGRFDTFGEDNDVYGNSARVLLGFEGLPESEYQTIFTGFMENLTMSDERFTISVKDKRKQLSKAITYSCTNKNALTAIREIIEQAYPNITYSGIFYDVDQWDTMTENAPVVTINMQKPEAAINVIQDICSAVFGVFFVNPDNLFSFRVLNISDDPVATIMDNDILSPYEISYNPTEVLSSVRVGYARNWTTTSNPYTFLTDDSRETAIFAKYKTYTEREFLTVLPDAGSAADFASTVLDYTQDVHATFTITTSMQFWNIDISNMVDVEIKRYTSDIFGVCRCEVTGIVYNLDSMTMKISLRKLTTAQAAFEYRITEDGEDRITERGDRRILEY